MALNNSLVLAHVMHARQRPRPHVFHYRVYYIALKLHELSKLTIKFLSLNRWNLFSIYEKDHGPRNGTSLLSWIKQILLQHQLNEADGEIILLTMPRLFGYAFNPVSFWFCLDKNSQIRAVLSEVRNTFGEHHSYLSYHDDHRPIAAEDWLFTKKEFHVSPFLDVTGQYQFRFSRHNNQINVSVNYYDDQGLMLATNVMGLEIPLTSVDLLKCFVRFPLMTFKVITSIHLEAIRLITKGARYRPKPPPPSVEVTR